MALLCVIILTKNNYMLISKSIQYPKSILTFRKYATSRNTILMIALLFFTISCKKKPVTTSAENPYIFANSGGLISKREPVRIVFTEKMVDAKAVGGYVESGVVTTSPALEGKAIWTDDHTIEFTPDDSFKSDETYSVQVNVGKIASNVPGEFRTYEFSVHTIKMAYSIDWKGWNTPSKTDYTAQQYLGTVYSSDFSSSKEVEPLIAASMGNGKPQIEWSHSPDGLKHEFTIRNITRSTSEQQLTLSFKDNVFNGENDKKQIAVPPVNTFTVHDVFVSTGTDFLCTINFTDPIGSSQDLSGLISIENYLEPIRTEVEGNNVRLFMNERIKGKHRIIVDPSVQNSLGKSLGKQWSKMVEFEDTKPLVRFVNQGNILPENDGLIIPFEAINLKSVDVEIVKIFSNNILQYYQTYNGYEDAYDINRVGRIILQQKIDLSSLNSSVNNDRWVRYGLDMNKLITSDRNSIYQIRIGFRRAYSSYLCSGDKMEQSNEKSLMPMEQGYDSPPESIYDNNYAGFGEDGDYEWDQMENPCSNSYYNKNHFAVQSVYKSNISLIAKGGETGDFFVAATDIITAKPASGVALTFYDFQQQSLATATTDNNGFAKIKLAHVPFMLVGSKGDDKSYLLLNDAEALSLSKFDVSGQSLTRGMQGYIYGDRGVWRPGDSIYLNAMIEDKTHSLPEGHPVTMEVTNPRGSVVLRLNKSYHPGAILPFYFNTETEAPTGVWTATVRIGGASFSKQLNIETIKPNKLKIELTPNKAELLNGQKSISTQLQANWLIGTPAANKRTTVDAFVSRNQTPFKNYADYIFDISGRSTTSELRVYEGKLNSDGAAKFSMNINPNGNLANFSRVLLKTTVFEQGGNFSTDFTSVSYSPFKTYMGLKLPVNSWGEPVIKENGDNTFQVVSINAQGGPVANAKAEVKIYQMDWQWWWDGNQDASNYISDVSMKSYRTLQVSTNGSGKGSFNFNPGHWGRYFIKVTHSDGHQSGGIVYAGYPEDADSRELQTMVTSLKVNLVDKEVRSGEPIRLTFEGLPNSRALISVEGTAGIISATWSDCKAGVNKIEVPTVQEMGANCYVYITLIQPHNQSGNDLPLRLYGVVPVKINNPDLLLNPVLTVADEIRPDGPTSLTISEKSGKPMTYTIDIVDEGLLSLTNYSTPDPYNFFNAKNALAIKTWDLFDKIIGGFGGRLAGVFAIGGDMAAKQVTGAPKANRFKPAVVHLGPFQLGKGAKANHKFNIENYMGAVRVMVVARNEQAYGNAGKTVKVVKPLMVSTTMPRKLAPGDIFNMPVNVFVTKANVKDVRVDISDESGLIKADGKTSQSLTFTGTGEKMLYFPVKVSDREGKAVMKVNVSGNGEKSTETIEIQVENPNPPLTLTTEKILQAGSESKFSSTAPGMKGSNSATLELSTFPDLHLSKHLNFLINYPYGCLEQTISAGFPQIFLSKIMALNAQGKLEIRQNIDAVMSKLQFYQLSNGGFSYWPGANQPDQYTTSYAGHFMLEARKAGYQINPSIYKSWLSFQQKAARAWSPQQKELGFYQSSSEITQAYRLFTLALAGSPELGAMNQLRSQAGLVSQAKWLLASAYGLIGKKDIGTGLITSLSSDTKPYMDFGGTFGSDVRDQAIKLQTLLILDRAKEAGVLAKSIAGKFGGDSWYSTHSISMGLGAVASYLDKYPPSKEIQAVYTFQGKKIDVNEKGTMITIDLGKVNDISNLSISNKSKGVLYATLTHTGKPAGRDLSQLEQNLALEVRYTDKNNQTIDPEKLAKGTEFYAIATVRNQYPGNEIVRQLALNQIFPAGWEIVNDRMQDQSLSQSNLDYQDYRDDRVYSFFDLSQNSPMTVRVKLIAAYQGTYYLPPVSCAAMYNNTVQARLPGRVVSVF